MIAGLIRWALDSRPVVLLLAVALAAFGTYAFLNVDVEAYPDPAPAIVEIIAQFPGASAEDVERQVTIPLEVALAGMQGLDVMRSQSMFQLADVRCQFEYGVSYLAARQEVLNRLAQASLPDGVTPVISPESPTGEIMRFTLESPQDAAGRDVYTLNDLKSLMDFTLERRFRRVPRIIDVGSYGGTMKRYEIQPDPDRLRRYGISLAQLESALAAANRNVGGQYINQGDTVQVVRGLGLIGGGSDPMETAMAQPDARSAVASLRQDEAKRIREIRDIVVASVNNVPVRVGDLVDGGPVNPHGSMPERGVVVGYRSRLGQVSISKPRLDGAGRELTDAEGARLWRDEDDVVQGIVLLRKGEDSLPALADVKTLVAELNDTPGQLLPGVQIVPYYDRTQLIHTTTETVRENLFHGMALVGLVLLMFLGNVRTALIVAINVPLAVMVAFAALYLRGESANLLSIGAVDFGILVDSSVIIVENIYRRLTHNSDDGSTREVVQKASLEVQRSLLFSTGIMVCAFLPLFTMDGPAGQIFRPMAHTYAFALAGALVLAVTLSPVLCEMLLGNVRHKRDNALVRWLSRNYARQLRLALRYRFVSMGLFALVVTLTLALLPMLGREFMPQLEEGNIYVRGTFPLNASLPEVAARTRMAREVFKKYPEVESVVAQVGRPDDGTDPTGFYNVEFYVPMKPRDEWPVAPGTSRPRTKNEVVAAMNAELGSTLLGVDWNFSQYIRDGVMEAMSGVKGENSLKIIGPDLAVLEATADRALQKLAAVPGVTDASVFRIIGQSGLNFAIDKTKCARWGVTVDTVEDALQTAVGGKSVSTIIEGERTFDMVVRWPQPLRSSRDAILDVPVDVASNVVSVAGEPTVEPTLETGGATGASPTGSGEAQPAPGGTANDAAYGALDQAPRRRLRDFVTPLDERGAMDDAHGSFVQPGASTIYREQGRRLIALKFGVRDRDLGGAVADAQAQLASLIVPPLQAEWSGEFAQMQLAEQRLKIVVPLSLLLVVVMLYLAFFSMIDVLIVLANVVTLVCGGVLALLITGTNFSVSAAVGFISVFGVAIMNGLILVSSIHRLRLEGSSLDDAVMEGSVARLRPMLMTILTAILGLLPAALSTRIGAQSQQPLAIVVIGGMLMSLLLNQHLTPVLYYVFRKRPPAEHAAELAA